MTITSETNLTVAGYTGMQLHEMTNKCCAKCSTALSLMEVITNAAMHRSINDDMFCCEAHEAGF